MPTGTLLGATEVRDGAGALIATSTQGNYENGEIDLVFSSAAAMSEIERGTSYTLIDNGGGRYNCVAKSVDVSSFLVRFTVVG